MTTTRALPFRLLLTVLAALLAVGLHTSPAQAGPAQREAVLAAGLESVVHSLGTGAMPRKLTRRTAAARGAVLPKSIRIASYKRLGANHYKVCLWHKGGGWATYNSRTGQGMRSGKGRACRYTFRVGVTVPVG